MALIRYPQIVIIDGQPVDTRLPLIPPVAQLMPRTQRWRKVKPCGTAAAWRRHQRRGETMDDRCRRWRRGYDKSREGR
jgi:hypothetical protein